MYSVSRFEKQQKDGESMQITDVRVRKVNDEGKMKAIASVTFENSSLNHAYNVTLPSTFPKSYVKFVLYFSHFESDDVGTPRRIYHLQAVSAGRRQGQER